MRTDDSPSLESDRNGSFSKRINESYWRGRSPKEANAILFRNLNGLDVALLLSIPLLVLMGGAWSAVTSWSLIPGLTLILVVTVVALSFLFNPRYMDSLFLTLVGTVLLLYVGFSFSPSTGGTMLFGVCALQPISIFARNRRIKLEMLDAKARGVGPAVKETDRAVAQSLDQNRSE